MVCDERYDNAVVRIDKNGFHPAVYYIQKSQSVMWVWKGSEDEAHNVIHVKSPDSDVSLSSRGRGGGEFHPAVYYIQKSQSMMWVWKGSEDEAHNVIHVKSPDSDISLSPRG